MAFEATVNACVSVVGHIPQRALTWLAGKCESVQPRALSWLTSLCFYFRCSSLATLEDLDWLPLDHRFSTISEIALNVTISMLTFLQERGVATPGRWARELVRKFVSLVNFVDSQHRAEMLFKKRLNENVKCQRIPLFLLIKGRRRLEIWNSKLHLTFHR